MDYKKTATEILSKIGHIENVVQLEHCSTRLRFTLKNQKLINEEALKLVPGVMGVVRSNQFQIIIGNDVVEVYAELMKLLKHVLNSDEPIEKEKMSIAKTALDFMIGVFQPLVPAIAGAGVLKSVLLLLSTFGLVQTDSSIYQILVAISDATFYFLPLMVAVTTANKLGSNRLVAIAAVGVTLLPAVTKMIADGTTLFGIQIQAIGYNAQIFPAILCVILLAIIEKIMNKISPKSLRIFLVPMVALAITVPMTLLFLGPLGYNVGTILTSAILYLYSNFGFVALAILGAILPMMIATGMHKTLLPYAINTYGDLGYEMLYLPASLAHNISEAGACFAVAIKAKDATLKSTAMSAAISAFMGITEPALYGVTLQNKRVLYSVMLSGLIGGGFIGLVAVKAFAVVGPGFPSMSMFMDPEGSMNIIWAIAGFVLSLSLSFIFVLLFWKETATKTAKEISNTPTTTLVAPIAGQLIDLKEVSDEMFSKKTLGDGFAIIPEKGELVAPVDGVIQMIFDTKHSIGMTTKNGAELLFHVGLDTVRLEGKPFEVMVAVGDSVKAGDLLLKFDIEAIKAANLDIVTPVVITNSQQFSITINKYGSVVTTDAIAAIQNKGG